MKYELKKNGYCAVIESHGAELVSFRDNEGNEYIWDGNPAYWPGRNPLLFPIVGNLKNGAVNFDGETYEMGRHGFARDNEFTVVEQGEDFVVLELCENEMTLAKYPYPFKLQVCQQLMDNGFVTAFRVENTGDRPMPFCIGAHTAFRCPMKEGENFDEYEIVFDQKEMASMRLLTAAGLVSADLRETVLEDQDRFPLEYDVFARVDTMIFDELKSTGVSLLHKKTGRGVHMDFQGFPMMAFWTKGVEKAPFICIEPWHGCAAVDGESGEFKDKPHCITLAPGEAKELSYRVIVQ
ncbi:MAG: aldose 1-epimerase family protein [Firmicutes bacterium]|nr:aldose 1-epimerase family protein [Bacillota bacterium]